MTLFRTAGPTVEPVTLAQAKAYLRVTHESEDGLIEGLVRAAREAVEDQTGLALIEQKWRLVLDRWPRSGVVKLLRHPVISVEALTVYEADGVPVVIEAERYCVDRVSRPARVQAEMPAVNARALNGIEIDFTAGYGTDGAAVPEGLKLALLVLVGHWFEMRGSFGPDEQPVSYPVGFERLVAPYRLRRL
ncbi:MAG: phage head-tail connector protein [Methylobacterium mesophilicum]|nr:phage head-tail connector protein [Methylobacterium mesophilicum]